MADLGFQAFDADNHYYEAEDAFTRHIDRFMQRRCMQWATLGGRKRLLVGGRVNHFIPNPTFDPVAKPGILDDYFRGRNPENKDIAGLFGELDPIDPAYRDRDARIKLLDSQGLAGALMFPTLGVGMEESLKDDPEAVVAAFRGFNRWLEEDWGFHHLDRLFAAPYMTLVDPDAAVAELDWALEHGARVVCMRPGPVAAPDRTRSPADPLYDAFWARVNEAGIVVAYHSGDAGYRMLHEFWGGTRVFRAFHHDSLVTCLSAEPIHDTLAALLCHGLFDRHPNVRVATIECGSAWVASLLRKLGKAYGQQPSSFGADPVERFRRQIFVAPYYEDDIPGLRDRIGVDRVLFGSDFPHAEGLAEPTDFIDDLEGFSNDEVRRVMRDNGLSLVA